ncbi:MAG TPA: hypothetical protein VKF61_05730, partial [Candidatus Polarisedimenticolia bacterium]|nr:hypothetical protein [Candidatus Polarisedimenticolia bacterium]
RLGRAGTIVERRLAPALARMHGRRLYRLLGYVRLGDYLTERLGMSLRRCQAILRLERALAPLPRLARAFDAGVLSVSKLELVVARATPETEEAWLERASRLPLAALREAAREASSAAAGGTTLAATADSPAPDSTPDSSTSGSPTSDSPAPTLAPTPAPTPTPTPDLPIDAEEPGRTITFSAPAPVLAMWHWTLDLVRRVAGQQEPAWRCIEYLAAEFLSGVPDSRVPDSRDPDSPAGSSDWSASSTAGESGSPSNPPQPPVSIGDPPLHRSSAGDARGMSDWLEACAAVREALASIGASADPEAILTGGAGAGLAEPADELDAWELDARLRGLVRLRQSLAWRQGRLLAAFAALRLFRDVGFNSAEDWVGDRLAMSPRRARYLVSLDRRLRDLPLLADAYRRGMVSWCQARLLVRIVRPTTQSQWIRYARQVTVRRLEDVIISSEVNAATSTMAPASAGPPAHVGAAPAPAPAHIVAPPLPPNEPPPDQDQPAVSESPTASPEPSAHPNHAGLVSAAVALTPRMETCHRHTSAPGPDATAINPVKSAPPPTWRRISFWCPLEVASLWDSALRSCRAAAGSHLEDWECFLLLVQALRDTWENPEDPHWRRRYRILERDNWRCKVPGCTSRSGLNAHHIQFRSQQGGNETENLVTLCVGHHQGGLHAGHLRCSGRAPDSLWWDLGVRPGGDPLTRYFGDRIVAGPGRAASTSAPAVAAGGASAGSRPTRPVAHPPGSRPARRASGRSVAQLSPLLALVPNPATAGDRVREQTDEP